MDFQHIMSKKPKKQGKKDMDFHDIKDWWIMYFWFQEQTPKVQEKFRQEIRKQTRIQGNKILKQILSYATPRKKL